MSFLSSKRAFDRSFTPLADRALNTLLTLLALSALAVEASAAARPNFVICIADDVS
jgi:hypothetical protein